MVIDSGFTAIVGVSTLACETTAVVVARNPPSELVAVIVAVPAATPVTRPLEFTVAIDGSELDHTREGVVPASLVVVGEMTSVEPVWTATLEGSAKLVSPRSATRMTTDSTMAPESTDAVIRADPTPTAVTIPLALTVATDSSEDT